MSEVNNSRKDDFNNRYGLNKGLAQMLKGGVIMDVTTPEQARIAEAAGACAVMALEIPDSVHQVTVDGAENEPEKVGKFQVPV